MGKNRIAVECTRVVREAGDHVVLAVVDPADDGRDGWQPSFRHAAEEAGIPTFDPPSINAPSAVARVRAVEPELTLSFQYAQILKAPVIGAATLATLNLHFGPLPRYRGVAPIAWALINGERTMGVTLHHVDPGVDSGDIVFGAEVSISAEDTGRSLYEKCTDAAIQLWRDCYQRIRAGDIPRGVQDPARALYYNRHSIDFSRRRIDWRWEAERLANWMRALIFPPFQYPEFLWHEDVLSVAHFTWDRGLHPGRPGQVLSIDTAGVVVGVPGGRIVLKEIRGRDSVVSPQEWAERGLSLGVRLE